MEPRQRAASLVRVTRSLGDEGLRVAYVQHVLHTTPVPDLAAALDHLSARAEQAEADAREAMVAVVDALQREGDSPLLDRLREEAAGESLFALERLIRSPTLVAAAARGAEGTDPDEAPVPDYGRGRPLTLGERKSLARRPDRSTMERLLADPHPEVIARLLQNPRLTEDDVVKLATKRPGRPDVLQALARAPRWLHRSRVRLALVLNPYTPTDVAIRLAGLLVRQELRLVAESTRVAAPVRAVCLEHLERRPPVPPADPGADEGEAPRH